ncbi:SDR family oxidoreductase [Paraliomyxa miuraensis]|uniref:SDR family oxidoreductase n=1 Tax=Paraliomyxa miuraensis TaxID=376150 RepID=UPI0022584C3A|nr:SDR family oxidoreductase [Paraliomyxa miuraensis]MCX4246116.1 SDR family oxidoreductase [Paraliomyxa miuraensis]
MALFLTGITGYIGSYVAHGLLTGWPELRIAALVRARSDDEARQRLWKSLQLHEPDFDRFAQLLPRIEIYRGDLTTPSLGLDDEARDRLIRSTDSVLHVAASLNRKSAKACFNVNLRGTLEIIKIARAAADHHGLRRFSDVSTVAVAGERSHEVVTEAETIDWNRSDYDPYARTKKFCEHMMHELLPDVPQTVFRPSTVLGDSRFPETTQFDMVRAFAALAYMRVLPLDPDWRMDICPADYVAKGIITVHMAEQPRYDAYNLSAGMASPSYREIVAALKDAGHKPTVVFAPRLGRAFSTGIEAAMSAPRKYGIAPAASLMKVFWPYLTYDTVFDNSRVVEELGGERPRPFPEYAHPLLRFAVRERFTYPYRPWPDDAQARLRKVA